MSIQESIDKLSQSYFTDINEEISRIYVDMEILQDFKLGALLQTATVPEEIEYIQSRIPVYNAKLDLETAKYFPVLHKTDEELMEVIQQHSALIAAIAPWTKIYQNFHVVLKYLYLNTRSKDMTVHPLTIIVNSGDMLYPLPFFDRFAKQVQKTYPGAIVKASGYKRYEAEPDLYLNTDMFFLYDHEKFFNSPFLMDLVNGPVYHPRVIYTTPYVNPKMGLDKTEYLKGLTSTGATLNLLFDFFYMPAGVNYHSQQEGENHDPKV